MTIPIWVDGCFILTLVGLIGGGGVYLLSFFLKSRCRVITCCCVKCEREPIPSTDLNNVNVA